ncbi:Ig-like domain-containing protein [Escherichia coli]|nr:Ig-like domain-containing protein [Escherichia coli]
MSGPKPVKSVSISPDSPEVKAGESVQLAAQITPADAGDKTGVWESDNLDKLLNRLDTISSGFFGGIVSKITSFIITVLLLGLAAYGVKNGLQ